jgi:hypothetical protein
MKFKNSALIIPLVASITACGGNGTNIAAGQEAFAYNNAAPVAIEQPNNGDAIELSSYSDVDVDIPNTDITINANNNWMQLTINHKGSTENTNVYIKKGGKSLLTELAGKNNKIFFDSGSVISNFLEVSGENNSLTIGTNSSLQFDSYYTAQNLFRLSGNGHTIDIGEGINISDINFQIIQGLDQAHTICLPKSLLSIYSEDESIALEKVKQEFFTFTEENTIFKVKGADAEC